MTVPSPLFATQTEPAPTAIPVGACPTGIVDVTARVLGSIRVTASPSVSATQTAPWPIAIPLGPWPTVIGVSSPVGSTRVTALALLSVTHTPSAPTATAVGAAFGSIWRTTRALRGLTWERSPDEGATQTAPPRVATEPGPPGTTLPIRVLLAIVLNCASMRLTVTDGRVGSEPTAHTPPGEVASPVGVS